MAQLYQRLKIDQSASQAQIRQAYHRLALLYHPDRNCGDKEAEDKFKDIVRAFEILGDRQARALYDQGRIDDQGRPCFAKRKAYDKSAWTWSEASTAFQEEFERRAAQMKSRKEQSVPKKEQFGSKEDTTDVGPDQPPPTPESEKQYRLAISFEEACLGTVKHVRLPNKAQFKINIPAGVETGKRLRVKSAGENGKPFVVKVTVEPHVAFQREEHDIKLELPITPYEAFFGVELDVPTIHGPAKITVPPQSRDLDEVVMEQMGVRPKGAPRGDQIVCLKIALPRQWPQEASAVMATWKQKAPFNPRAKILNLLAK